MEIFNLSLDVIMQEQKKFNLEETFHDSLMSTFSPNFSANFCLPYNRCAFMYLYATCNTGFIKDRILSFLSVHPKAKDLLSFWRSCCNQSLCSLSCGPGLDYLAFSLAVLEFGETLNLFNDIKIITKCGAWRDTVKFLSESIARFKVEKPSEVPDQLEFKNVEVLQGNIFDIFSEKMMSSLQNCMVALMFKTLNLTAAPAPGSDEETRYCSTVQLLVSSLKAATTIFFIDSKPSANVVLDVLYTFPGHFLFKPAYSSYQVPMPFPSELKNKFKVLPERNIEGVFFVWQKLPSMPDSTPTSESIQTVKLKEENVYPSSTGSPIISSRNSLTNESIVSDTLSSSSRPESRSSNNSSTFSFSPVASDEGSYDDFQTKLSTSASRNYSKSPDSPQAEYMKNSEIKESGFVLSTADRRMHDNIPNSTDVENNTAYLDFPPLNLLNCGLAENGKVNTCGSDQILQSCVRPQKQESVSQEGSTSEPQSNSESKSIQSDPVVGMLGTYLDSINFLADKITKLISCFDKEATERKKFCKCHGAHFDLKIHHCGSYTQNCDHIGAYCLNRTNQSKCENMDSSDNENKFSQCTASNVGSICSCSVERCMSQPQNIHCRCGQHIPRLSGERLLTNGAVNGAVPSIVIPLQNINEDDLSRILSIVKNVKFP